MRAKPIRPNVPQGNRPNAGQANRPNVGQGAGQGNRPQVNRPTPLDGPAQPARPAGGGRSPPAFNNINDGRAAKQFGNRGAQSRQVDEHPVPTRDGLRRR